MEKAQQQESQAAEPEADTPTAPSPITQNDEDLQKLKAENAELKNAVRMRDAKDELTRLLTAAGSRSPALLFAAAKDDLQFSDEGKLQNAEAIVGHLKLKFPDQFGIQNPTASIDGGTGTRSPGQLISAESLSRMSPAQIQKLNWDDVRRVISER